MYLASLACLKTSRLAILPAISALATFARPHSDPTDGCKFQQQFL
jgi:hypothetical protein